MEYRHKWECDAVVDEVTCEREVMGLNLVGHVARKKCRNLRLGMEMGGQWPVGPSPIKKTFCYFFGFFCCLYIAFAMGQSSTRQGFAVCPKKGSRQSWFCRRLFVVCCLPCAIHDKEFAVCIWVLLVSRSGGGNASVPKNLFSWIHELMTCIWKYYFQKQIINGITHSKKYFSKNGSDNAVTVGPPLGKKRTFLRIVFIVLLSNMRETSCINASWWCMSCRCWYVTRETGTVTTVIILLGSKEQISFLH